LARLDQQLTLVVELENRFRVAFGDGDEAGIDKVGDVVEPGAASFGPPPPFGLRRGSPKLREGAS
jgi:hypothetical protein